MMQAMIFHENGGPEVVRLEDVPQLAPGPGEVLLRVRVVGVNRTLDCEVRSRRGHSAHADAAPFRRRSGRRGGGAGENGREFQPGDRVVCVNGFWCGL